jgi:hypothetical protein
VSIIEAILDVITTLLTLCYLQALKTERVPSTAGLITSISSFGSAIKKGEAT